MAEKKVNIRVGAKGDKRTSDKLKKVDKSLLRIAKSATIAGLAFFGTRGLIQGLKGAVRVGKEFEQSMANVKAITGATGAAFLSLERDALRLGGSTKFTASQVADLQTEFGRLGFTSKEILKVTEATLDLAAATGEGLAESAIVAGGTIRAFSLDASETSRITDVMAKSFSSSALDLRKFTESMKVAGPVAGATGFKIEGTTAILGTLSNRMVDSSLAGTALRRIFLELSNENSRLAKRMGGSISSVEELVPALNKLKEEGISTAEITELVGLRAVTAFQVMVDSADDIDTLRKSLEDAGGAAKDMAEIQLDVLEGKTLILKSATEDLGISLSKRMNPSVEDSVEFLTRAASAASEFFKRTTETSLETTIRELQGLGISTLNLELAFAKATDAKLKFAAVGLRDEEEISKNLENSLALQVGLLQEKGRIQAGLSEELLDEEALRQIIAGAELAISAATSGRMVDQKVMAMQAKSEAEAKLFEIERINETLELLGEQNQLDQADLEIIQKKEAAAEAVLALQLAIEESKKNQVSIGADTEVTIISNEQIKRLKKARELTEQFSDSMVQAIIFGQDMGDAVKSALKAILVQYTANLIKQHVISKLFKTKEVVDAQLTGAAIASAYAPAAAMVQIATLGGATVPAVAGLGTTVAAAQALATFQHGGSFRVGGSGGPDSQLVVFRASPEEQVTIETPQQIDNSSRVQITNIFQGGIVDQDYITNVLNPAQERARSLA